MKISVIIPTYNRASILTMCLKGLEEQSFPKDQFEVIVINDGSRDETESVFKRFKNNEILHLKTKNQENSGQGVARNHGLEYAKGKLILLMGDDIIPHPEFLNEHWQSHEQNPEAEYAVLGLIEWHPELELNDFMRWMVNGSSIFGRFGGHQFAFEKLERGEKPNFNFFYTSNLSLKRDFLGKNPFDLSFNKYGWEDIELGYRLEKEKGMTMIYNNKAIGYHYHPMDEDGLAKRMEMIGRSTHLIDSKYPELKKVPTIWKKGIFRILSNSLSLWGIALINRLTGKKLQALYYYALSKKYFLKGVKLGYNDKKKTC